MEYAQHPDLVGKRVLVTGRHQVDAAVGAVRDRHCSYVLNLPSKIDPVALRKTAKLALMAQVAPLALVKQLPWPLHPRPLLTTSVKRKFALCRDQNRDFRPLLTRSRSWERRGLLLLVT